MLIVVNIAKILSRSSAAVTESEGLKLVIFVRKNAILTVYFGRNNLQQTIVNHSVR